MKKLTIRKYSIFVLVYIISVFISYKMMLSYGIDYREQKALMIILLASFLLFSFNILFYTKKKSRINRKEMVSFYIFLLVILLLEFFLIDTMEFIVYDFFIVLSLDIILYIIDRKNVMEKLLKKDAKYFVYYASIQVLLMLVIIPYSLIIVGDLKTIEEGRIILEEQGYQRIEYVQMLEKDMTKASSLKMYYDIEDEGGKDKIRGYVFHANKNGKKEVIFMNMSGGKYYIAEVLSEKLVYESRL